MRNAIFPGYQAPVVRKAADGERELVALSWGFVLLQKDKAPKRVTNIRDDKAQSKFWRTSFEQRRCLVPASSYCVPKGGKPATWHRCADGVILAGAARSALVRNVDEGKKKRKA